jgi:hypothetical protein
LACSATAYCEPHKLLHPRYQLLQRQRLLLIVFFLIFYQVCLHLQRHRPQWIYLVSSVWFQAILLFAGATGVVKLDMTRITSQVHSAWQSSRIAVTRHVSGATRFRSPLCTRTCSRTTGMSVFCGTGPYSRCSGCRRRTFMTRDAHGRRSPTSCWQRPACCCVTHRAGGHAGACSSSADDETAWLAHEAQSRDTTALPALRALHCAC